MKKYSSFLLICILVSLVSCKKNNKQIFSSDFNSQSDLAQWNVSTSGDVSIDNGAVYISNITSCFHLNVKDLVDVRRNQSYVLKLRSKHFPSQIGDPAYCVGNLMIRIQQDGETLLMDGALANGEFVEEQFTFTTESGSPIEVNFLIGSVHGVWIDYIGIEKV